MSEDPRELPEPSDTNDDRGQPPSAAETERGDSPVNDQLDVTVHDSEVLAEIEMMTNLIIATSESDGPLPQPSRSTRSWASTTTCPRSEPLRWARPASGRQRGLALVRPASCASARAYPLALP